MVDTVVEVSTATVSSMKGGPGGLANLGGGPAVTGARLNAASPSLNNTGGSPVASGSTAQQQGNNLRRFDEDVSLPLVKVVVLGAPGVGKTSIVRRFVGNEFTTEHRKTKKKSEHFPSLILNDSLFELKLIDLPVIPFFPADNMAEWNDYRYFGLRSASAYLLVYDVSVPSTFQFVKTLRDQMFESRDMTNIPVIVAANKMDLVASIRQQNNPSSSNGLNSGGMTSGPTTHPPLTATSSSAGNNVLVVNAGSSSAHHNGACLRESVAGQAAAAMANSAALSNSDHHQMDRKEISHMVRKSWRSAHVECSAKYNWNIVSVFRELAVTLDMIASGQVIGSNASVRKRRCLVF